MKYSAFFIIISLLFAACSTRGVHSYNSKQATKLKKYNKQNFTHIPQSDRSRSTILYKEYVKWRNTPYSYGGDEKKYGVDCSSFIQQAYYGAFKIAVPRTTRKQSRFGYKITKSELRVGDMIFFRTGYNKRHVGIVIEKGKFVHTSSKKGVTISSINNPYWKRKYWQSRRVLPQ